MSDNYEVVVVKVPQREAANRHRVPLKQWRKWNAAARKIFNELYGTMEQNQSLFLHPKQSKTGKVFWRTTCYNAAWTAADAVGHRP